MRLGKMEIPFRDDAFQITVVDTSRPERPILADTESMRDAIRFIVRFITRQLNKIRVAVNANDASSMVIPEGDSLPTPTRELNGRFAMTEKSDVGGEDQIYWCHWNGAAYTWKEIT